MTKQSRRHSSKQSPSKIGGDESEVAEYSFQRKQLILSWVQLGLSAVAGAVGILGLWLVYASIVEANRAWIAPLWGEVTVVDQNLFFHVKIANLGREPAINVNTSQPMIAFDDTNEDGQPLHGWPEIDACKGLTSKDRGPVFYPLPLDDKTVSQSFPIPIVPANAENLSGVYSGTKGVFVIGCIAYETFSKVRYSQYCFFEHRNVENKISARSCEKGSYAT